MSSSVLLPLPPRNPTNLEKTKEAMNLKQITQLRYNQFNKSLKDTFYNDKTYGKIIYHVLKNRFYKNPSTGCYYASFPKYNTSLEKRITIHKISKYYKIPLEVTYIINEYIFEKLDTICYSLFHLSNNIYYFISKNENIKNSRTTRITELNYDTTYHENIDEEFWIWKYLELELCATNCSKCSGYKKSNTTNISPRVICYC